MSGNIYYKNQQYITKLINDPLYISNDEETCHNFISQKIENQLETPCSLTNTISFKIVNFNGQLLSLGNDVIYIKEWKQDKLGIYCTLHQKTFQSQKQN